LPVRQICYIVIGMKNSAVLFILMIFCLLCASAYAQDFSGERIVYDISPIGTSEYTDLGVVDFLGKKMRFCTFHTQVLGFDDLEKIYSDPKTFLPLRVERNISMLTGKEYLVEEYFPKDGVLITRKYKGGKQVDQYDFKADMPIQNAILLPFSLRREPNLDIGWSLTVYFPDKYKVTLVSIEEIEVPAGKFMTYHFTSEPHKFETWITKDDLRIPIKIKGAGGIGYTLSMKKHSMRKSPQGIIRLREGMNIL